MLNNIEHRDVKINLSRSADLGDDIMFSMTFPFEFNVLLANYPILIYEDPKTSKAFPVALFGFEEGENLFLKDDGWHARYIPIMVRRQPFIIGFQENPQSNEKTPVITFDPAHPRVSRENGEAVFNEDGSNTPYLDNLVKLMEAMDSGRIQNELLIRVLQKHQLLERSTIAVTLDNGRDFELIGFSTIDEEKFHELSADVLYELNQQNLLLPITNIIASVANIGNLVELKNSTFDK